MVAATLPQSELIALRYLRPTRLVFAAAAAAEMGALLRLVAASEVLVVLERRRRDMTGGGDTVGKRGQVRDVGGDGRT
jgi:hypothetical protein